MRFEAFGRAFACREEKYSFAVLRAHDAKRQRTEVKLTCLQSLPVKCFWVFRKEELVTLSVNLRW